MKKDFRFNRENFKDKSNFIPYQLCLFHYLQNISRRLKYFDTKYRSEIQKSIRERVRYERRVILATDIGDEEKEVLVELSNCIFYELNNKGTGLTSFPGITLYEGLEGIKKVIRKYISSDNISEIVITHLKRLLEVLPDDEYLERYEFLIKHRNYYNEIRSLLFPKENDVQLSKDELIGRFNDTINIWLDLAETSYLKSKAKAKLTELEEREAQIFTDVNSSTKGFYQFMFTYLDHPIIPKTNNDTEKYFGRLNAKCSKIKGHANSSILINTCGEMLAMSSNINEISDQTLLEILLKCPNLDKYQELKLREDKKSHKRGMKMKYNRDKTKYLDNLMSGLC